MNKNTFYLLSIDNELNKDDSDNLESESDNDSNNDSDNDSDNLESDSDSDNDSNNNSDNKIKNLKTFKRFPIEKYSYNNYDKNFIKKKINHKKILCINFILNNKCIHSNKCSYAHSIQEQNIEAYRKKTIDILNSTNDLSYINFSNYEYKLLMKDLLTYTKLCHKCVNNKCTGGFNCKFGSCLEKYVICYDDLNYGYCNIENCNKIHLSKRNLKPILKKIYYTIDKHIKSDIINLNNELINNNIDIDINNDYILNSINKLTNNEYNCDEILNEYNCDEILNEYNIEELINNTEENKINIDNTIFEEYISDSDDECIKSIFL
jgi:hypothetical protein